MIVSEGLQLSGVRGVGRLQILTIINCRPESNEQLGAGNDKIVHNQSLISSFITNITEDCILPLAFAPCNTCQQGLSRAGISPHIYNLDN